MLLMLLEHALQGLVFLKCGENSEASEHNPIFINKTAGRGRVKPGPGPQISVLPRTSGLSAHSALSMPPASSEDVLKTVLIVALRLH